VDDGMSPRQVRYIIRHQKETTNHRRTTI